VVTYQRGDDDCEVITLNFFTRGHGVGTALLLEVKQVADKADARLWLIATNEELRAVRFDQRRRMDMTALHRNFVEVVRAKKPGVEDTGADGFRLRARISRRGAGCCVRQESKVDSGGGGHRSDG